MLNFAGAIQFVAMRPQTGTSIILRAVLDLAQDQNVHHKCASRM